MNVLKEIRNKHNFSQITMALTLGITRQTLIKHENSENPPKYLIYAVKWLDYCTGLKNKDS